MIDVQDRSLLYRMHLDIHPNVSKYSSMLHLKVATSTPFFNLSAFIGNKLSVPAMGKLKYQILHRKPESSRALVQYTVNNRISLYPSYLIVVHEVGILTPMIFTTPVSKSLFVSVQKFRFHFG